MTKTVKAADFAAGLARRYYSVWQKEKTAEVYIYGYITASPWQKSDVSAYGLATEIAGMDVDEIHVYINSAGGEVAEGVAIYTALCRHPAKVVTHCDGFACSAASVIFMAGDERLISDVGMLMIHEASCCAGGNAAELRKAAEDLSMITEAAATAYKAKVNIGEDELAKMLADETWLTPGEAVEKGFATAIESWGESESAAMNGQGRIAELVMSGLGAISGRDLAKEPERGSAENLAEILAESLAEMRQKLKSDMKSLLAEAGVTAPEREPGSHGLSAGGFFDFAEK